jgi:hypothetical protein
VVIEGQDAVRLLADALGELGLAAAVEVSGADRAERGGDLSVLPSAGSPILLEVRRLSLADGGGVRRQLEAGGRRPGRRACGVVPVLVADRVTQEARGLLREAGWGWFDLRGHVRLVADGVFVDADVAAIKPPTSGGKDALAGRVGLEVACSMLIDPDAPASVRGLARALGRAPSSVSGVLAALRQAGLVGEDLRPVVGELFWRLAERWPREAWDVASVPAPGQGAENEAMRLGLADVERSVGWALTDTLAAARYGASVGVRSGYPPDFYVPDQSSVRRALHLLGTVSERSGRAATIRVAPVAAVCAHRIDATGWSTEHWPLAHPLFVALDLAGDPGRGREVLQGWTPPEPWRRVW